MAQKVNGVTPMSWFRAAPRKAVITKATCTSFRPRRAFEPLEQRTLLNVDPAWFGTVADSPTPTPFLSGDLDGDGVVGLEDFGMLKLQFGTAGNPEQSADLDGDGRVDLGDFGTLKSEFGKTSGAALIEWESVQVRYVVGEWLVTLTEQAMGALPDIASAASQLATFGISVLQGLGAQGTLLVHVPDTNPAAAAARFQQSGLIVEFEPNFAAANQAARADGMYPQQWPLENVGQVAGTVDADIDAEAAWALASERGAGSRVIVGVIDSGVDWSHPDLAQNIWTNPGETAGDGIDNDGNGFVDDVHGWDFADNDSNPTDLNGHGTHVAGIIAGAENGTGIVGVAPNAAILPIRVLGSSGSGSTADVIRGIRYATMMRQRGEPVLVTNNSYGSSGQSKSAIAAIRDSHQAGMLFVAAAGNDGLNTDAAGHYPSAYTVPNIVSVAATDSSDSLAAYSNYGLGTVDVAAPGSAILSTLPGGRYGYKSGTSMAAPHVAGVIALAWSANPDASWNAIEQAVLSSADELPQLDGQVATGGRLNAAAAVEAALGIIYPNFGGGPGEVPLVGNWDGRNGDQTDEIGLYIESPTDGDHWVLALLRGDGSVSSRWRPDFGGGPGEQPIVGDWNGDGATDIGLYIANPTDGNEWVLATLDENGGVARVTRPNFGGGPGETPLVGDWDGNGITDIGLYIASPTDGTHWVLATLAEDGSVTDVRRPDFGGGPGEIPLVGNWDGRDGDRTDEIGLYIPSPADGHVWVLATLSSDGENVTIKRPDFGGGSDEIPLVGNWDAPGDDRTAEIGLYRINPADSMQWVLAILKSDGGVGSRLKLNPTSGTIGRPLVGNWDGEGGDDIGVYIVDPADGNNWILAKL